MAIQIQRRCLAPHWMPQIERRVLQHAAQRWRARQTLVDMRDESAMKIVTTPPRCLQQHHAADMHWCAGGFQIKESGIEATQGAQAFRHESDYMSNPGPRCCASRRAVRLSWIEVADKNLIHREQGDDVFRRPAHGQAMARGVVGMHWVETDGTDHGVTAVCDTSSYAVPCLDCSFQPEAAAGEGHGTGGGERAVVPCLA